LNGVTKEQPESEPEPEFEPESEPESEPDVAVVASSVADLVAVVGRADLLPVPKSVWPRPIVGDHVVVGPTGDHIAEVAPRRNVLRRADPAGGEQVLAANVDVVVIVCGLDRPLKAGRVQRAAALAWDCAATPVLVLSKADLNPHPEVVEGQASTDNPGIEVFTVSVAAGTGIDALRERLTSVTAVLLGESGSGKSTLTNALLGRDAAEVGAVRAGDHKGRHTTTDRQLFELPTGGRLIDTPGIRAVGLPADLSLSDQQFADLLAISADCRFRDCRHTSEPECAVLAAVADGTLAQARLDQWLRLTAELESAERRSDVHAQRQFERQRTKEIYKPTMKMKRERG
jgi:ribosome biogenesis GTPase